MLVKQTVKTYVTYKDSGNEWIGENPKEWKLGGDI